MMDRNYELEVIAFDAASCRIAEEAGADRIELCANPLEGGTTPSHGMIRIARKITSIQLFPIIRPRGGDFVYSDDEFEVMKQDVLYCKEVGCDGLVIGLLNADGSVDVARTKTLVELTYPLGVTFHRAIDHSINMEEALEAIIKCGCERILTSGGMPTAPEGAERIAALIRLAEDRIDIMPGSGIRSGNIAALARSTGAHVFHSSARKLMASASTYANPLLSGEMAHPSLSGMEVEAMVRELDQYFSEI
jgi:copper homeostasis protein